MDKKLLEELYKKYYRELYLYLYSISKNHVVSEELVQEVFLSALLSLRDDHPNFRAWLYKVGKNLSINYFKRAAREVASEIPNDVTEKSKQLPDGLIEGERNRRLYEAVMQLPELSREVILLQYFSGLPQKEIGEALGIGHEYVRVISHRARKQLRKELEVEENDEF